MVLLQNKHGKFDAMRPYMELEGIKVERAGNSVFKYQIDTDLDGLMLLLNTKSMRPTG